MVVADAAAAVEFLRTVFDAEGKREEDRPAEMRIGDSLILVSGSGAREAFPALLYMYVDDVGLRFERAMAAGAECMEEPADTPYGDRRAMVRDRFGNIFQIAARSDRSGAA